MPNVLIYTTSYCPFCIQAKHLLMKKGIKYEEINVGADRQLREEMVQKSGRRTVPQIWINNYHVGGCDDLYALDRQGRLDEMLKIKNL